MLSSTSSQISQNQARQIITPTKLNRLVRTLLQSEIGLIWLQAEISNFVAAGSGHWYFTLKDNKAQIRAAMFKQANFKVSQRPKEGDKVLVRASVSLYEPRGDYQLIVEYLELDGEGALKREFELLKNKLHQQGLFDTRKKRALPTVVQTIGVITSDSGAALHDVLSVLKRRAPDINVIIYPTLVQGEQAPISISKALAIANKRCEVDLLLITRGGGSLEDLWAFNDEQLAHDIASSQLPTVSAVGHEIDFSICDMVADVRAPTPSAAAELVSPDRLQRQQRIQALTFKLKTAIDQQLSAQKSKQRALFNSLHILHPVKQIQQQEQYLDGLNTRLEQVMRHTIKETQSRLHTERQRLHSHSPRQFIKQQRDALNHVRLRLAAAWQNTINRKALMLQNQAGALQALSPLATLSRGYSITFQNDKTMVNVEDVVLDQPIITKLYGGEVISQPIKKQLDN